MALNPPPFIGTDTDYNALERTRLAPMPQLQAIGGDVDIAQFKTEMDRIGGLQLRSAITDASITRTIEGASTLTISVDDDLQRTIELSGKLGRHVWVNLDGLWFALVGVNKSERTINLKFEEREVHLLRQYNSFIKADRLTTTRAEFALRMIQEVRQVKLSWVIPELHDVQQIGDAGTGQTIVDASGQAIVAGATNGETQDRQYRAQGIPTTVELTVKTAPATKEQIDNASIILRVGLSVGASTKVLVASIMTAITESRILNLPYGDRDSVGAFQQRPSQGWPASGSVATDAVAFFNAAKAADQKYPNLSYAMLCQTVQRSGYADGSNYAAWESEAIAIVNAFGQNVPKGTKGPTGQPDPTLDLILAASESASNPEGAQYYYRGRVSQVDGSNSEYVMEKENSWDCLQRLAEEVNWRCFVVSGTVYFISELWLFRSKPFMTINEESKGIDWINYDYDEGKKVATVTVVAHLSRWSAPPGSIVWIKGQGKIVDGRYIVNSVSRSIFNTVATITLKKPLPILPEPTSLGERNADGFLGSGEEADVAANAHAAAQGEQYGSTGSLMQPVPSPYLTSVGGYHITAGDNMESYGAYDFFAPPGSPVVACEAGRVTRLSGYDPATGWHPAPGGALGWSVYIRGESGSMYYYTHLKNRTIGQDGYVELGQQFAEVVEMPGVPSHVHLGVSASYNGYTINDVRNAPVGKLVR